jgi:hypothetical protein
VTNPLVAEAHSSTTWYTGLGLIEDAAQISSGIQNNSWVDGTLGTVGASLDVLGMVIDPLGSLVAWGVSWLMEHVKPLKEALDWLAGNPDEISAHAATWQNVSKFTMEARQQYSDAIKSQTAYWHGDSGDAYREHAGVHVSVMEGLSTAAHGISYAVQGAGLLVALVRGIVRDLIAQFIGTLAARLPQWLAEAGLTLGAATPVVIGQVASLVAKWVNKIQHFIRALLNSLRRLRPLLHQLGEILTGLMDLLKKLARSNPLKRGKGPGDGGGLGSGWREGDPIPRPLNRSGDPLDVKDMDPHYKHEHVPGHPDNPWARDMWGNPTDRAVKHFDDETREAHRLFVDGDGNLRRASDGSLFDTQRGVTHWSRNEGGGRAIFVMDENGNLYASNYQNPGEVHHSSFLSGEDVAGAGEIRVHGGKIIDLTDRSGHYAPPTTLNDQALDELRRQGLNTDGMKKFDFDGNER